MTFGRSRRLMPLERSVNGRSKLSRSARCFGLAPLQGHGSTGTPCSRFDLALVEGASFRGWQPIRTEPSADGRDPTPAKPCTARQSRLSMVGFHKQARFGLFAAPLMGPMTRTALPPDSLESSSARSHRGPRSVPAPPGSKRCQPPPSSTPTPTKHLTKPT